MRGIDSNASHWIAVWNSETGFRALFDHSLDAVLLTIPDGTILAANSAACSLFGMTEEEICRAGRDGLIDREDPGHIGAAEERARTGKLKRDMSFIRKDGTKFTAEVSSVILSGDPPRAFVSMRDITERKRAEQALRASEKRYRTLFESIDEGFCVVEVLFDEGGRSFDYRFLEVNPALERHAPAFRNACGRTVREIVPDVESRWTELFGKVAVTGVPTRYLDYLHSTNQWFEGYAFRVGEPEQHRVAILFTDVTGRKHAEETLTRLAELIRVSFDAIIVQDWDGTITTWNKGAERLYGYAEREAVGKVTHKLLATVSPKPWPEVRAELLQNRFWEGELRHRRSDQSEVVVSTRMQLFRYPDGSEHILEANRDITGHKRAEEALIRSEKLATAGRLAASIAHEVNNPLAGAMNALFLASSDPDVKPETKQFLEMANQELCRAAHITQQTLGFYREGQARELRSLPKLVDELLAVYAGKLRGRNITVQRRYRCRTCKEGCESCFSVHPGELRQILSNLLANGIDALPDGGTMLIRASRFSQAENREGMVSVTVADNGEGIRVEDLKRIFEPFYTTKQDVGTGLGLWITQELVRKHGGSIRVRSRKDRGTVFRMTFPAMQHAGEASAA